MVWNGAQLVHVHRALLDLHYVSAVEISNGVASDNISTQCARHPWSLMHFLARCKPQVVHWNQFLMRHSEDIGGGGPLARIGRVLKRDAIFLDARKTVACDLLLS